MTRLQRGWIWLAMVCGGVTLYQGIGFTTGYLPLYGGAGGNPYTGCARFANNGILTSIDFCYLLDCNNGFLGGLVQPCPDGNTGATADGATTNNLLVDCSSSYVTRGGTGTTGTTGTTGQTATGTNTGTNTGTGTGTNTGTGTGTGTGTPVGAGGFGG